MGERQIEFEIRHITKCMRIVAEQMRLIDRMKNNDLWWESVKDGTLKIRKPRRRNPLAMG